MKKVLLIGIASNIIISLKKELKTCFQIETCLPNFQDTLKAINDFEPHVILMYQNQHEDLELYTFRTIHSDYPDVPVLTVCPKEDFDYFRAVCPKPQFSFLFRPVGTSAIIAALNTLIKNHISDKANSIISNTEKANSAAAPADKEIDEAVLMEIINLENTRLASSSKEDIPIFDEKYKILAVDDSPVILRNIRNILKEEYDVYAAPSGEKALEMLNKLSIDLILLDYEMPEKSGLEVLKEIRQSPNTENTPVIFLTGVADRERISQAIQYKPSGYLLKPIDAEMLNKTILEAFWKTYK